MVKAALLNHDAGTTCMTIDHSNKLKTPFLETKYMRAGRRNTRRNGAKLLSAKLQTVISNRARLNAWTRIVHLKAMSLMDKKHNEYLL